MKSAGLSARLSGGQFGGQFTQLLILGRGRDKGLLLGLLSPDYKSPDAQVHTPNMDDENNKPPIVHDGVVVDS